ncbi:SCO family protein [Cytobacillus solani]|uniref:Manganese transporter n=1 Tax=Cytobacillus solani TaxID=1637975 RepID=A0A0Q3SIT0_9BACI|nr:SCO family protein [Cytobacillus solani]KOP82560.1 manganese transporter [Bacillus sp. FJAT-21945]KQL19572.1 manganese transporter [Cytobacillus solani]USK52796.1 SCO family protein [Cytobacillus solani]
MKKIYIICSSIVVLGIIAGISFFIIRDMTSKIPDNISLVTMHNENYEFSKSDKKLKLVEFMYTHCPDICPTTTQRMNLLKNDLVAEGVFGKNVEFLSVSIDPYRDTPEKMMKYMKTFDIEDDGNWTLLTGDQENMKQDQKEIRELAETFQFQYRDPGDGFYVHSTFVFLIDENNKFIKKFPMGEDFNKDDVFKKIMKEI